MQLKYEPGLLLLTKIVSPAETPALELLFFFVSKGELCNTVKTNFIAVSNLICMSKYLLLFQRFPDYLFQSHIKVR